MKGLCTLTRFQCTHGTMSGVHDTKSAAEPDPASSSGRRSSGRGGGGGGGGLVGIATVQKPFRFLDGPADVLSASTACRCLARLEQFTR